MALSDSLESLKGFDVNDLDINNAGSWPWPVKLISMLIVFALIVAGFYWFLIKDQYSTLEKEEGKESQLKQQYESKAFQVANLDEYREQMREMEETFGALLKQLPADTEVPGLLEDITNTGLGTGLVINSIALQPEVSKEFYVELPINISVSGSYHDMASFVSGVASLPRIVTLHDFDIAPVGKGPDELDRGLSMKISAKTYRYNPDQASEKSKRNNKRKKK
jgi:type IV pilus assembly protein PilO